MLIPASSEFVSLCRSQTTLLTQGLGASSSGVYLTADLAEGTPANLIPVVVYPEEPDSWAGLVTHRLPDSTQKPAPDYLLPANAPNGAAETEAEDLLQAVTQGSDAASTSPLSLPKQQRLVLPLMDQETVIGLLVVEREDRQWNQWEQVQLEQIANTLAIARILDQRHQWSVRSDQQRRLLQAQQQDTLADLLHQFRNPLTTLRTLGKLLLKRLGPADANREIATSIIQESERLQDLLQQFDVTIDPGQVTLNADPEATLLRQLTGQGSPAEVPLLPPQLLPAGLTGGELPLKPCLVAEVLDPLLQSAIAIAQERNLELRAEVPLNLPPVQANPQALREVLSNLIDNALKYTPASGQVLIQISQKHLEPVYYQVIAVHDTGPGIPPQDLKHVFERHYRGVQAQTDISGSGLGLAIARELVKQMQGEIQVFSPAQLPRNLNNQASLGPGSTFVVWLLEIHSSTQ